jgi:methylenetetrahydrofolate reductase (NADPH)
MASQVAGMDVPDAILGRLRGLSKEDQAKAGLDLCCEIANEVRQIEGVAGLHIMAIAWPEAVPQVVRNLGLYPRPTLASDEKSEAA